MIKETPACSGNGNMFFSRRFFPFFMTFFFGAFNDNMFRNALVVMITYHSGFTPGKASSLSFLAMALLMLPFFPFSAMAGEFADKYGRGTLFRLVKLAEVILMLLTFPALCGRNFTFLLILLCLMGTQSAFFSPLKYSYMPRSLEDAELLRGNAYVNAGTYAAILIGTLTGNTLVDLPHGYVMTGALLVILAAVGLWSACRIPDAPPAAPETKVNFNIIRSTFQLMKLLFRNRSTGLCALGLSSFWMTGALYVSQLAGFCKDVLFTDARLIPVLYAVFSAGVAAGSLLCAAVAKRKNTAKLVIPALILMAFFTFDLFPLSRTWVRPVPEGLATLGTLVTLPAFYRIVLDLFMLSLCGGFYSVPLNTIMQRTADPSKTAQIIAGNNVLNSLAIAAGTVAVSLLMAAGIVSIPGIFVVVACVNVLTALILIPLKKD